MNATDLKAEFVPLEMATETTDDVKTIKPPRLGRGVAFGSEYGGGIDARTYIATAAMEGMLADGAGMGEPAEVARDAVAFADALLAELAK